MQSNRILNCLSTDQTLICGNCTTVLTTPKPQFEMTEIACKIHLQVLTDTHISNNIWLSSSAAVNIHHLGIFFSGHQFSASFSPKCLQNSSFFISSLPIVQYYTCVLIKIYLVIYNELEINNISTQNIAIQVLYVQVYNGKTMLIN